jgi:hypothetical protein
MPRRTHASPDAYPPLGLCVDAGATRRSPFSTNLLLTGAGAGGRDTGKGHADQVFEMGAAARRQRGTPYPDVRLSEGFSVTGDSLSCVAVAAAAGESLATVTERGCARRAPQEKAQLAGEVGAGCDSINWQVGGHRCNAGRRSHRLKKALPCSVSVRSEKELKAHLSTPAHPASVRQRLCWPINTRATSTLDT